MESSSDMCLTPGHRRRIKVSIRYVSTLRTLAKSCNFCQCLHDSLLRDRIVFGVKEPALERIRILMKYTQGYLPAKHRRQSLCSSHLGPTTGPGGAGIPLVSVRVQGGLVHHRHDLLRETTAGEVPGAEKATLPCLLRPDKGV